jgi:hypothetical protein
VAALALLAVATAPLALIVGITAPTAVLVAVAATVMVATTYIRAQRQAGCGAARTFSAYLNHAWFRPGRGRDDQ